MKTIEQLEAEAKKAKEDAEAAGGTDANLNQLQKDAEDALAKALNDVDYKAELDRLNNLPPPPGQRTEKDKAKYTVEQILIRHPELKDELQMAGKPVDDGTAKALEEKLLRNQVEGIIRQGSKSEDEVRVKMHYYDNKIVKTGNIHEDADNAIWLATKGRTRNAIAERDRNPIPPEMAPGPGQKPPMNGIPELPITEVRRLTQLGLKQTAPGVWEGVKIKIEWDKNAKQWNQTFKS